jgi:hypothetical protein
MFNVVLFSFNSVLSIQICIIDPRQNECPTDIITPVGLSVLGFSGKHQVRRCSTTPCTSSHGRTQRYIIGGMLSACSVTSLTLQTRRKRRPIQTSWKTSGEGSTGVVGNGGQPAEHRLYQFNSNDSERTEIAKLSGVLCRTFKRIKKTLCIELRQTEYTQRLMVSIVHAHYSNTAQVDALIYWCHSKRMLKVSNK